VGPEPGVAPVRGIRGTVGQAKATTLPPGRFMPCSGVALGAVGSMGIPAFGPSSFLHHFCAATSEPAKARPLSPAGERSGSPWGHGRRPATVLPPSPCSSRKRTASVGQLAVASAALQFFDRHVDASPEHYSGRIAFPQKRSDTLSGPERGTIAMLIDQVFCHTPDVGIENPSCSEGSSPLSDRPQRRRGDPKRSYHPCGARYISAAWTRH